jgi:arogenate dehydrogenase (NADP+)
MDAAGPLDYEEEEKPLKIGIVGFGNYHQFLVKTMVKQGHPVLAHSRTDYTEAAARSGVEFFRDADDFCEEHPEIILLCSSIISVEAVLKSLPTQRLKRSTLFADVLSVKEFPHRLFLQVLSPESMCCALIPCLVQRAARTTWATSLSFTIRLGFLTKV